MPLRGGGGGVGAESSHEIASGRERGEDWQERSIRELSGARVMFYILIDFG